MKIKIYHNNLAEQNSYLLIERNKACVIDLGFNGEAIANDLDDHGWELDTVLLTHGHYDHIRDIQYLAKTRSFLVVIHRLDKAFLSDDKLNYSQAFGAAFHLPESLLIKTLKDGERIAFGGHEIRLHHTPGHTAGSACYQMEQALFTGDTLFADSVGRTDLATGNTRELYQSLRYLRDHFSREIRIYPGHGNTALLKDLINHHPFLMNGR